MCVACARHRARASRRGGARCGTARARAFVAWEHTYAPVKEVAHERCLESDQGVDGGEELAVVPLHPARLGALGALGLDAEVGEAELRVALEHVMEGVVAHLVVLREPLGREDEEDEAVLLDRVVGQVLDERTATTHPPVKGRER